MSQRYSNTRRASDPHTCCNVSHSEEYATACADQPCLSCDRPATFEPGATGWFYWFCFQGCMPEGDPTGPFVTEAAALADARECVEDDDGDGDESEDE